ncbi:uncharacterized protein LOC112046365 [Bicyclus anynana]|uniref:Glycosyltransferase family 92 protein n=1 Tax=Bicyclus anynana TaxID=110368 RepID=A0A6J1N6Z7_BICAN|nr:uncharacterized protein LOC112046365 [Bicyclus anynana]
MSRGTQFVRVIKFLLAGVTVFCVSWIASVNEWHSGLRWSGRRVENLSTMRTIVGYSAAKLAELDRPSPVACSRLPAFPEIPLINRTWSPDTESPSWQRVRGTSVSLYAAYYDDRAPQRYIRILAHFHGRKIAIEEPLFCQTRSANPEKYSVEVVAAKPEEIWWHEWDQTQTEVFTPLLLSCPLTEDMSDTSVVSIVTQPCENPSNGLLLKPSKTKYRYNRTFTICVKDMIFQKDISQNLIEWIETNKLLGVDMIDMYIDSLNKKSEDILLRYRSQGIVRLFHVPIKYSFERSLWQRRRDHIITYNDCLYRNIRESKFIIPLDIDEIILPKIADTWGELLKRLTYQGWNPNTYSAILVRNVFFFDFLQEVRNYKSSKHTNKNKMYMKRDDVRIKDENVSLEQIKLLNDTNSIKYEIDNEVANSSTQNNYKSVCGKEMPIPKVASHTVSSAVISPIGHYSKSFMLTKRVLTAFNHYPLASLGAAGIAGWPAPFNEVQLNHYKEACNSTVVSECEIYSKTSRMDYSAARLSRRLTKVLATDLCSKLKTV